MSIASRIESITEHLTNDWNVVDSLGLHTKKLPKEYTQIDYIESSGTQYIDTGVNADYKLSVKFEFSNLSQNSYQGAMSGGNTTNRIRHHLQMTGTNNIAYWAGLYDSGCSTIIMAGADYDSSKKYDIFADVYNKKYYLDGIEIPGNFNSNDFDTGLNYYLFGRNTNNGVASMLQMKMYSFQMYYENELVRDFVPCYRNSDNEVGLYDLVNDVFYTNQGTGAFTYGEIQEEHIDRNLENLNLPLKDLYNDVSDKTDLSVNGVVGRTSQDGDPTPENPVEINNLSGDVEYRVRGKNFFDKNNFEVFDGYYIGGGGNFRTASNNHTARISIEPNTTYTVSKPLTINNRLRVGISSHEMTTTESFDIWGGSDTATDVTLTSASDSKYMYIFYAIGNEKQLALDTLQVEKGSTATTYEPYISEIFPLSLKSRNLFDKDNANVLDGMSINAIAGNIGSNANAASIYMPINPNTTYCVSKTRGNRFAIGYSSTTPAVNVSLTNIVDDRTKTSLTSASASNSKYLVIYISLSDTETLQEILDSIMINEGSTATTYEPYYDIELCKIDTYEDKIYSSEGRFYLYKETGKSILNGSECWNIYNSKVYYSTLNSLGINALSVLTISTHFISSKAKTNMSNNHLELYPSEDFCTRYPNVSSFKQWLSTNNITLYYELATPTTTEITQENYPALYNALKQIQDYLTAYKINKEFILGYSSPEIEY